MSAAWQRRLSYAARTGSSFTTGGVAPRPAPPPPPTARPAPRAPLLRTSLRIAAVTLVAVLALVVVLIVMRPSAASGAVSCPGGLQATPDGRCVQCLVGSDCASQICGVAGACVQCNAAGGCAGPQVCVAGACATPCTTAANCPTGFVCSSTTGGGCVQCTTDADCSSVPVVSGTLPATCDPVSNTCGQCLIDTNCPSSSQFYCAARFCVAGCGKQSDCPPGVVCTSGVCASCTDPKGPAPCPSPLYCTSTGCVSCIDAGGCTSATLPICSSGTCVSISKAATDAARPVYLNRLQITDTASNHVLFPDATTSTPTPTFGTWPALPSGVPVGFTFFADPTVSGAWAIVVPVVSNVGSANPVVSIFQLVLVPGSRPSLAFLNIGSTLPTTYNVYITSNGANASILGKPADLGEYVDTDAPTSLFFALNSDASLRSQITDVSGTPSISIYDSAASPVVGAAVYPFTLSSVT